jgi:hypothetical protein
MVVVLLADLGISKWCFDDHLNRTVEEATFWQLV